MPYTELIFIDFWDVAVEKAHYNCDLSDAQTSLSKDENLLTMSAAFPARFDSIAV